MVINADHLLTWGIEAQTLRDRAMANLRAWSATAPWTRRARRQPPPRVVRHGQRQRCRADPAAGGARAPRRRLWRASACPRRATGPGPADRGVAAACRRRVPRPVRGLRGGPDRGRPRADRGRLVRARRRRSTSSRGSPADDGAREPTGRRADGAGRDRRRGRHRDDHPEPARRAERAHGPDEARARRGVPAGRARRRRFARSSSPAPAGRSAPARTCASVSSPTPRRSASRCASATTRSSARCAPCRSRSSARSTASRPVPARRWRWPATCESPSEAASFALAFGRVGLVPDSGATWFLPRLVGAARAAEIALLGRSRVRRRTRSGSGSSGG